MWLLVVEVPAVVFFIRTLGHGRLDSDHPWVTGLDDAGREIWPQNLVYQSPNGSPARDAEVVTRVGQFMRSMVKRSTGACETPQGPKRRMPHAVNYLHGSVHYNGAFLVFEDCADVVAHVENPEFRKHLQAFILAERREVTLVLRQRDYDPLDYAHCVAALRANLPYFTNGNGPTPNPVLWGNKAPYASLNAINGAWMRDMWRMWRGEAPAREAVTSRYFDSSYPCLRRPATRLERWSAWLYFLDVRARGKRGNIFFSPREAFDPSGVANYKALGFWRWYNVEHVARPRPLGGEALKVSVVIPTRNEAANIEQAVAAARRALAPHEIIVVDGGSVDETTTRAARAGAMVLAAAPGRGPQLRAGADAASGDILVFLHADAQVSPDAGRVLRRHFAASGSRQVATFRLRFAGRRHPGYRLLGWVTRLDGYLFSFGDQGIACRREFYDFVGGFPAFPLFEDVEFFRRARRVTRISSLPAKIHVSERRFRRRGALRELAHNTRLLHRYARGANPAELARAYHTAANRP